MAEAKEKYGFADSKNTLQHLEKSIAKAYDDEIFMLRSKRIKDI